MTRYVPSKELMDLIRSGLGEQAYRFIAVREGGFDDGFDRGLVQRAKSSSEVAEADDGVAAHNAVLVVRKPQADILREGMVGRDEGERDGDEGEFFRVVPVYGRLDIVGRELIKILEFHG